MVNWLLKYFSFFGSVPWIFNRTGELTALRLRMKKLKLFKVFFSMAESTTKRKTAAKKKTGLRRTAMRKREKIPSCKGENGETLTEERKQKGSMPIWPQFLIPE